MAEISPPAREETIFIFEDKPNIATMISGGLFLGVAVYFITQLALNAFDIELVIVQWILALIPVLISIRMGSDANASIKIDTKTGYIVAENKEYSYEAYAHEPVLFMVLEKTSTANGRTYTDYKLSIKDNEGTSYDVPLKASQVPHAINIVEKAKNAIPIAK